MCQGDFYGKKENETNKKEEEKENAKNDKTKKRKIPPKETQEGDEKNILKENNETHQCHQEKHQINLKERLVFIFTFFLTPTIVILVSYFFVRNFFINKMVTLEIDNIEVLNSANAVDNVIAPFFTTIFLIISFILTYVVLTKFISGRFVQEKYNRFAKKSLKCIEIGILLLGLMTLVYTKSEEFPYTGTKSYKEYVDNKVELHYFEHKIFDSDGNEIASSEKKSIPGTPSIDSLGVNSSKAKSSYKFVIFLSQIFYSISKYFSVIVTIAGAIIFPLKSYTVEKSEPSCVRMPAKNDIQQQ